MNDASLNSLLKWGVEHSESSREDAPTQDSAPERDPSRGLSANALAQLLGGPSDADLMKGAMEAIVSPDVDLEQKLIAFDNFEQLVEGIDNANNIGNLGLWMPLAAQLDNTEPELRMMAAWCIGTAVQNNEKAQERALVLGVVPKLVKIALEDPSVATKKKAILALSSEIRNYQPALDEALPLLPQQYRKSEKIMADDMEQIDAIIGKLRENVQQGV